jgi:shikimate dehydrogenase
MDYYGLMGNPVQHSKSPQIHQQFARSTAQIMRYETLLVAPGQLAAALTEFQARQGKGVNITAPFKQTAFQLVDHVTEQARQAAAINTIRFNPDGSRSGENTDGIGLVRDLTLNLQYEIRGKTLLLLGSGGVARAVLGALLAEQPARIIIANRTHARATELAAAWDGQIEAYELTALHQLQFDLVINGTSAGHDFVWPLLNLHPASFCYDMNYDRLALPGLQNARRLGVKQCSAGWGMLVEQAASAFYFWRGIRPDTKDVLSSLNAS